jgi:hypothetical protein
MGNLTQLSYAMWCYRERYGHFPPAYVADQTGKPVHSWRVLLLEFTDLFLYNKYNFNEPWDGPNNRKLATKMPSFYACPNDHSVHSTPTILTSYVVVVGPATLFPGGGPASKADVRVGNGKTILIAEVADSGINWMEPRDLDASRMSFVLNDPARPSISSNDPNGPGVAFVDGTKDRLGSAVTPVILKAMTTVDGDGVN